MGPKRARDGVLRRVIVMYRCRSLTKVALVGALGLLGAGCYSGAELEDKEPPPGYPGGRCLDTGGCLDGICLDGEACFDPDDPCKGFYCGGNGSCMVEVDDGAPMCMCDLGYSNAPYTYFCTANDAP